VKGFRDFITRGNLLDLAVAVVIGAAFTAIVTAIVKDLITPLIGAIWGTHSFEALSFKIHGSTFPIGDLVNTIIYFLIVAAVVYFVIVKPMAAIMARRNRHVEATTRDCPECLSTIPVAASRCMYCTAQVPPVTASPLR
jgi:large conductance mechanosensitive channel